MIHKEGVPLTPIMSPTGAQIYSLTQHLTGRLRWHQVRNSMDFIHTVTTLRTGPRDILISFDVVSLFTKATWGCAPPKPPHWSPLGGHHHTPSVGKQASENRGDQPRNIRPLMESDLTECLSGGLPVLIAGDLNANHTGIFGCSRPGAPSCVTTPTGTPASSMTRTPLPLFLTNRCLWYSRRQGFRPTSAFNYFSCTQLGTYLSWSTLRVERTTFQNFLNLPDFMRVDKVAYQACLEDRLPQNPVVNDEEPIEKCVEELSRTT
jgi:hypothetical protein